MIFFVESAYKKNDLQSRFTKAQIILVESICFC